MVLVTLVGAPPASAAWSPNARQVASALRCPKFRALKANKEAMVKPRSVGQCTRGGVKFAIVDFGATLKLKVWVRLMRAFKVFMPEFHYAIGSTWAVGLRNQDDTSRLPAAMRAAARRAGARPFDWVPPNATPLTPSTVTSVIGSLDPR